MPEFHFAGCIEIKELLGYRASDEQQLLELIEEVPVDSIYYHTHSFYLRHPYIAGAYPNDFATWAAIQVRDRVLGEKLAVITPTGNRKLEDIRAELVEIIDQHLAMIKIVPYIVYGQQFHFMKSRIIEIPTGIIVHNLEEFVVGLKQVDVSAIYNHIFEAKMRGHKSRSDFSIWLEEGLGRRSLADQIEKIDNYMYSLEGLREKILAICALEVSGE